MLLPAIEPNMPKPTFNEFVMHPLSAFLEWRAPAMFGGHGRYLRARCFGIVIEGRLVFKVEETNRTAYAERGTDKKMDFTTCVFNANQPWHRWWH